MTTINLRGFKGMMPARDPEVLPSEYATLAINCKTDKGVLESYRGLKKFRDASLQSDIKGIYRYGGTQDITTGEILEFSQPVKIVAAPLPDNTDDNIIVIVGDGEPKITNKSAAIGTPPYPSKTYKLGVPQPTGKVSVAINGNRPDKAEVYERDYIITYLAKLGSLVMEGKPSLPSTPQKIGAGQKASLTNIPAPVSNTNINYTGKRLYRRTNYTANSGFNLVAELITDQTSFTDDKDESEIDGDKIPDYLFNADPPVTTMNDIVVLPNGIAVGSDKNALYLSYPYQIHAWGVFNRYVLPYDIAGIGQFENTVVACTSKNPVLFSVNSIDSVGIQEVYINQGCISKKSIVSGDVGVVYASANGLIQISSEGVKNLTGAIIDRKTWESFNHETITAIIWKDQYIASFEDTTGRKRLFMLNLADINQGFIFYDLKIDAFYNDPVSSFLLAAYKKEISLFTEKNLLNFTWKSGKLIKPVIMINSCRILKEGNIAIKIFKDGVQVTDIPVPDKAFRVPGGKAEVYEIELSGTGKVSYLSLADSMRKLF